MQTLPWASKTTIVAGELRKQRELASKGEDYLPRAHDMRSFASEGTDTTTPAAPKFQCSCIFCPRTFGNMGALTSHIQWAHSMETMPKDFSPAAPHVSLELGIRSDGYVELGFSIHESSTASVSTAAARPAVREQPAAAAESEEDSRRQEAQRRKRAREDDDRGAANGPGRRGQGRRSSYSVVEKVECIDRLDTLYADEQITNKGAAWADPQHNPKYYGAQ